MGTNVTNNNKPYARARAGSSFDLTPNFRGNVTSKTTLAGNHNSCALRVNLPGSSAATEVQHPGKYQISKKELNAATHTVITSAKA